MTTAEQIVRAGALAHEACDILQRTLASASALEARAVLALMAKLRPVADDAEQLAADIGADAEARQEG